MKKLWYVLCLMASLTYLCTSSVPASALSCAPRDLEEDFRQFGTVVTGTVLSNSAISDGGSLELKIDQVHKGTLQSGETVTVRYEEDMGGTMSWAERNNSLLIFAMNENGSLTTPICPGSLRVDDYYESRDDDVWLYGFDSWRAFQTEFEKFANEHSYPVPQNKEQNDTSMYQLALIVSAILIAVIAGYVQHKHKRKDTK